MFFRYRIAGVILLVTALAVLVLDAGGVFAIWKIQVPVYLVLFSVALFLLLEDRPPYTIARVANALTHGKYPGWDALRKLEGRIDADRRKLDGEPRREYLHRNRFFFASLVFLICFGTPVTENYLFSRRLATSILRSQLLDIVEEVKFQTPSAADRILLGRSAEIARISTSGLLGWGETALVKRVPRLGLSPRALRTSLEIVVAVSKVLGSQSYMRASDAARYNKLLDCYRHQLDSHQRFLSDLARSAPDSPAEEQDRKTLLILAGRMAWGLSDEGSNTKYAGLAGRYFGAAEALAPPLSSCHNGLGLAAAAKITRLPDSTGTDADLVRAALGEYEKALEAARSPVAAARVRNNLADLRVRLLATLAVPAWRPGRGPESRAARRAWRSCDVDMIRSPMTSLREACEELSAAIRADGEEGIYFATRGQAYSIGAWAIRCDRGALSTDELRWLRAVTGDGMREATRHQAVDAVLALALEDFQEAERLRAPLQYYFGSADRRLKFGLKIWDAPGYGKWLIKLEKLWI